MSILMAAARLFVSLMLVWQLVSGAAAAQGLPEAMTPPPSKPETEAGRTAPADAPSPETPPSAAGLPEEETACRSRLRALGVVFDEAEPIDEPQGCSAPHPVAVSMLSAGIALRPQAILTCAMAEASAVFAIRHAQPAAVDEFGSAIAAIEQASAYVCRPRHGTQKLSEHAFANALDWSAVVLADGTRVEVRAHDPKVEPHAFRLISRLQKEACGPFSTVLGPGSDADHADHFHFDLAERRSPFCQ